MNDMKCVMVIDPDLPAGVIANTAAILGVTLGKQVPELVGEDIVDASGHTHRGIVTVPVAMLRGDAGILRELRERLYDPEFCDLTAVDFSDIAQGCHVYAEYKKRAAAVPAQDHRYLGIAVYGNKKKVNSLTGSLPLLR